jgi:hypothetical protein
MKSARKVARLDQVLLSRRPGGAQVLAGQWEQFVLLSDTASFVWLPSAWWAWLSVTQAKSVQVLSNTRAQNALCRG